MVTSPATQRITVYRVECPDCGHKGKIAFHGKPSVMLDMLWCPSCVSPGGPLLVSQRGPNGRWVARP